MRKRKPAPVAPPAEPRPHVHRWNFIAKCCDPKCGATRCAHLARLDAAPGIRASWNRCSSAAAEGATYCSEKHGHLNAASQPA